jgi:hypothetical protein
MEVLRGGELVGPHPPHDVLGLRPSGVPEFHQSEVHQHGPAVGPDDDVLRLDVPVEDIAGVAIGQRVQQLEAPAGHLGRGQGALPTDDPVQALPLHEVHHQEGAPAPFKEVGDPGEVGMGEGGQRPGFLMELGAQLGQGVGVQAGLGDHLFDGDGNVQVEVPRPVDGAHSALSQQAGDAIAVVDDLTGVEGHVLVLCEGCLGIILSTG